MREMRRRLLQEVIIYRDFGRDVSFIFRTTVNGGCRFLLILLSLLSIFRLNNKIIILPKINKFRIFDEIK